jgi:DNA-binding transcriptional LysR family regulator
MNISASDDLTLRVLRFAIEVERHQSFTKAADAMYVSQPALSQQILKLERQLGFVLFTRKSKGVVPTQDGIAFLERAKPIIENLDVGIKNAHEASLGRRGTLKIASTFFGLLRLIPTIVSEFKREYPNIHIELVDEHSVVQANLLRTGKLDIGFLYPSANMAELEYKNILTDHLCVAFPKGHPLSSYDQVQPKDIIKYPIVAQPNEFADGKGELIATTFFAAGIHPKVAFLTENADTSLRLVAAGLGVTIAMATTVTGTHKSVDFRPINNAPKMQFGVAWRTKNANSTLVKNFLATAFKVQPATMFASH